MVPPHAAQAYARIGVETGVAAASPHRLVLMLYDGVLDSIAQATHHLAAGRIADKGSAISKAISIVESGLRNSLDREKGGAIASQLDALYDYATRRLLEAGATNDAGRLAEVHALLSDIRGAWQAVADRTDPIPRAA
jgi:flagellar protein FliS